MKNNATTYNIVLLQWLVIDRVSAVQPKIIITADSSVFARLNDAVGQA